MGDQLLALAVSLTVLVLVTAGLVLAGPLPPWLASDIVAAVLGVAIGVAVYAWLLTARAVRRAIEDEEVDL